MDQQLLKPKQNYGQLSEFGLNCIISEMDISPDEHILDIGACTGAQTVSHPSGNTFEADQEEAPLEILKRKILTDALDNIVPMHIDHDILEHEHSVFDNGMDILGIDENSIDKMFMCTVFHKIKDKAAFLNRYKRFLKPGGKIFIVESESEKRKQFEKTEGAHFVPQDEASRLLHEAGFINISVKKINRLIYLMSAEYASGTCTL